MCPAANHVRTSPPFRGFDEDAKKVNSNHLHHSLDCAISAISDEILTIVRVTAFVAGEPSQWYLRLTGPLYPPIVGDQSGNSWLRRHYLQRRNKYDIV